MENPDTDIIRDKAAEHLYKQLFVHEQLKISLDQGLSVGDLYQVVDELAAERERDGAVGGVGASASGTMAPARTPRRTNTT